jgi:TRAP-type C4-dicarboxylate transport system permease small subunit
MGKKRPDIITRILSFLAGFCLCVMLVLTFADVIARYILRNPIGGATEIIAFGMGFTLFLVLPLVTRDREHITVGLFEKFFEGRLRYVHRFIGLIFTLFIMAFVCFLLFRQAETMRRTNWLTDYLNLPMAPIVYVLCFFTAVAFFLFLPVIWRYVRDGGDPKIQNQSGSPEPPK